MKLIEKPLKVSYTNPIKDWYEENKTNTPIKDEGVSYENGMFISINNSKCFYSDLVKDFNNNRSILINIQDLIHTTDIGKYEYGVFNFEIFQKNDLQEKKSTFDYKKVLTGDFKFN